MNETVQERRRREMDEELLGFRMARRGKSSVNGWLRAVRQVVGLPVNEVARRLGVRRFEVFRLEQSEMESRIRLATLQKAARGLDCELVYALVPRSGSLTEMAAEQKAVRDEARAKKQKDAREKKLLERKPWLDTIGYRKALLDALRVIIRREGVRIRPRKTERGDEAKMEALDVVMKLAAVTVSAEEIERQGLGNRE
jgi:predicted DNA-binding mobile mystery protein A